MAKAKKMKKMVKKAGAKMPTLKKSAKSLGKQMGLKSAKTY